MSRIFGILAIVAAVYFAAHYVMTGSAIAGNGQERTRSVPQRAGDSVQRSFDEGTDRLERLLPEE